MDEDQKKLAEELLFADKRASSFVKKLFFGKVDSKQVFPYPSQGPEQRALPLLKELEEFVEKSLDPVDIDKKERIPASTINRLGKLGVLGMTVPKEYGGLGMSQTAYCRAIEIIAARCGSTAVFINAHQSIGLKGILLFGTEEQKKKYLPALASGRYIAAFALTEPNAGSDAAGIETRAVFDERKGVWRIRGKKRWITNGSIAHVLTVMAKTADEGGKEKVSAFLVTPQLRGFNVTHPALEKVGIRGTRTAIFELLDLEVPPQQMLGPQGSGLKVCLTTLDYGRTTFGAMCTGAAKFAVDEAVAHAKERIQFKKPLADFPLVKEKIAKISALAYAMEASTYLTAGLIDAGVEDVMLEAAILKVFASESLWEILYEAMQIFGGRSFFTDHPFEKMMRDARLNMIGEGSNEVLRVFISAVGMGEVGMKMREIVESPPLKAVLKTSSELLRRIGASRVPAVSPQLKGECAKLSSAIAAFGRIVPRLIVRHREVIVDKQQLLNKATECMIAVYTMMAVLGKASKAEGNELAVAKLYCHMAMEKFSANLAAMSDEGSHKNFEEVADKITGRNQHGSK